MVPFALVSDGSCFVVHVSALSSHTKDMLASPRVSLLVVASDTEGTPPQARPRVTIQGRAEQVSESAPAYRAAREAYLARFPDAADILEIPDFSFFEIRPTTIRFVAGFAQAVTLTPEAFAKAVAEA